MSKSWARAVQISPARSKSSKILALVCVILTIVRTGWRRRMHGSSSASLKKAQRIWGVQACWSMLLSQRLDLCKRSRCNLRSKSINSNSSLSISSNNSLSISNLSSLSISSNSNWFNRHNFSRLSSKSSQLSYRRRSAGLTCVTKASEIIMNSQRKKYLLLQTHIVRKKRWLHVGPSKNINQGHKCPKMT